MSVGKSIVLECCEDYGISLSDFHSRKIDKRLVACRVYTIARLRGEGFSVKAAARMMRRPYDTVRYWTAKPGYRENKRSYGIRYWKEKRAGETNEVSFSTISRNPVSVPELQA